MNKEFNLNQSMNASTFQTHESLEAHFNEVARKVMNFVILIIDKNTYRFTEIEFYFNNSLVHPDPYIHYHYLQKETGHWYFNGSGLDITFGDGRNFGGILIRGLKQINIPGERFVSGPLNVVAEIFRAFGNMSVKEHRFHILETDKIEVTEIVKSTRVGLKEKDGNDYRNKFYRYITYPYSKEHSYAEKGRVAAALLDKNRQVDLHTDMTPEMVNKLFGWKILGSER